MRATHTVALLPVPAEAFDRIAADLAAAGYDAVLPDGSLDMTGLALVRGAPLVPDRIELTAEESARFRAELRERHLVLFPGTEPASATLSSQDTTDA